MLNNNSTCQSHPDTILNHASFLFDAHEQLTKKTPEEESKHPKPPYRQPLVSFDYLNEREMSREKSIDLSKLTPLKRAQMQMAMQKMSSMQLEKLSPCE